MPFCKRCGAEIVPEDEFCSNCGASLKVKQSQIVVSEKTYSLRNRTGENTLRVKEIIGRKVIDSSAMK